MVAVEKWIEEVNSVARINGPLISIKILNANLVSKKKKKIIVVSMLDK